MIDCFDNWLGFYLGVCKVLLFGQLHVDKCSQESMLFFFFSVVDSNNCPVLLKIALMFLAFNFIPGVSVRTQDTTQKQ